MRTPDYETASEHATIAYLMARHNGASRDDADRAAVAAWDAVASGPMVEPCPTCGTRESKTCSDAYHMAG